MERKTENPKSLEDEDVEVENDGKKKKRNLNLMSILKQAHKVQPVPRSRKRRSKSTKPSISAENINQQDIRAFMIPVQVDPIITEDLGGSLRVDLDQSGEGRLEPGPIGCLGC